MNCGQAAHFPELIVLRAGGSPGLAAGYIPGAGPFTGLADKGLLSGLTPSSASRPKPTLGRSACGEAFKG